MHRSNLCDFSDAYFAVKGKITVTEPDNAKRNKNVAFKNNAPFINCISKIKTNVTGNTYNLSVGKAGYDARKSVKMKLKSLYH